MKIDRCSKNAIVLGCSIAATSVVYLFARSFFKNIKWPLTGLTFLGAGGLASCFVKIDLPNEDEGIKKYVAGLDNISEDRIVFEKNILFVGDFESQQKTKEAFFADAKRLGSENLIIPKTRLLKTEQSSIMVEEGVSEIFIIRNEIIKSWASLCGDSSFQNAVRDLINLICESGIKLEIENIPILDGKIAVVGELKKQQESEKNIFEELVKLIPLEVAKKLTQDVPDGFKKEWENSVKKMADWYKFYEERGIVDTGKKHLNIETIKGMDPWFFMTSERSERSLPRMHLIAKELNEKLGETDPGLSLHFQRKVKIVLKENSLSLLEKIFETLCRAEIGIMEGKFLEKTEEGHCVFEVQC